MSTSDAANDQRQPAPQTPETPQAARLADLAELERAFPQGVRGKRIHAVGAGGHGISAGLLVAHAAGALVTGCDRTPTSLGQMLEEAGIPIAIGHDNAHVVGADLVVTNPSPIIPSCWRRKSWASPSRSGSRCWAC